MEAVTVAEGLPAFVAGAAGAPGLLVIQEWCELPHPPPAPHRPPLPEVTARAAAVRSAPRDRLTAVSAARWGVTPMVKQQALKLAGEGYRVLIPDVYNG